MTGVVRKKLPEQPGAKEVIIVICVHLKIVNTNKDLEPGIFLKLND